LSKVNMTGVGHIGRFAATVGALALASSVACLANTFKFSIPAMADGAPLGTASATLKVASEKDKKVSWTLTEGAFAPDPRRDGKVEWPDDALSGSGSLEAADSVVLKSFNVTLRQSTGVDITYSLRLRVTLSGDTIRAVSIEQAR
jgi:hypothetical protein